MAWRMNLPPLNKGMMAETGAVLVILLLVH